MGNSIKRIRKPVRREHAEQYLIFNLLSFAASVILIRLFLELTGYPQVGNDKLHIAHVLWGGLLLYVASLLPLLFANRWVYLAGALLAGVGVGLFIDEVGKFITQNNDYFFPAAAPIIYAFFLLMVLLYLLVRRPQPRDARAELYHALEEFDEVLDRGLSAREHADLKARLRRIADQEDDDSNIARLARALLGFLAATLRTVPDSPGFWERCLRRLRVYETRWFTVRRLKALVVSGLGVLGLVALLNLVVLIVVILAPPGTIEVDLPGGSEEVLRPVLLEYLDLGHLVAFLGRLALGVLVGLALVVAAALLLVGREWLGFWLGRFGLLLSLTTVSLLDFYFDQFRAVVGALIAFILLLGVIWYRQRYLLWKLEDNSPDPSLKVSESSKPSG